MKIEVVRAGPEQQPVIEHLFQFYHYDWTEIAREGEETYSNVGENGLFDVESLDRFWNEPKRHPFLLKVNGTLAGFALVRQQSYLTGDPETNDMVEFFVMRKFRRKGVGREMATRLFAIRSSALCQARGETRFRIFSRGKGGGMATDTGTSSK